VDRPSPEAAMPRTIATIRRRVRALGVRDPRVVQIGPDRLLVEAPGYDDVRKVAWLATRFGRLTFQLVDDTVSPEEAEAGRLPPDDALLTMTGADAPAVVVHRHVILTGANLTDAQMEFDPAGHPAVSFRFDAAGTRRFAEITTENVGKRFAVALDGSVITAPTIESPITSGQGQITGSFTPKDADDLALLLRSGPTPAPVRVVEQSVVKPRG
jgi:protein-export membrane protein SecD